MSARDVIPYEAALICELCSARAWLHGEHRHPAGGGICPEPLTEVLLDAAQTFNPRTRARLLAEWDASSLLRRRVRARMRSRATEAA